MSGRAVVWAAWASCVLTAGFVAAYLALEGAIRSTLPHGQITSPGAVLFDLALLSFAVVGALIVSHDPRNRIGWIFCGVALGWSVTDFGNQYGVYALFARPGTVPGGLAWAWLQEWLWGLSVGLLAVFLPLLFPSGRLPSRRWRPVAVAALGALALVFVGAAFHPGALTEPFETIDNPVGIEAAGNSILLVAFVGFIVVGVCIVLAVASLILRLRRSRGHEREQIRWFAYSTVAAVVCLPVAIASLALPHGDWVGSLLLAIAIVGLPVSTGLAILRHRLYDIDVLVNRALVYGALTAGLAGAYLGLVLLLQLVFEPLTQGSDLAIAGSTLAVAALFRPARRRIQHAVDRRFYRRKYDAARTLEAFSARLREEVDLDALSGELSALVRETMQPAHVSLWLREAER